MTSSRKNRLELVGVKKTFEDTFAVSDVSLVLGENEFVSIIGPSGCGKSTLFNMISGLILEDEGEIRIDGAPVKERKGLVSYMYQKDLLLSWLKIIDNVALPLRVKGVSKKAARDEVAGLFETFGLEGFEHKYPHQLSGGMRQRAAMMRTYVYSKDIMLLDEPFGGLDALTKAKMQDWLLGVNSALEASILFITHDIEEAIYLSDRIYLMSDRPSTIKEEIVVDLPRPRNRDMMVSETFTQLKKKLLHSF
ncbi:ABC transporter ATP-binding protein [Acidaminobacter hydrogenoformans]|uniref:ABC-type nitrate/sulfonate/bicarbonate transport system, ATPase component n=1 Tax=Acidaminobacter hydrogenoformans DSM 2784 TaxID=1120920 RepID=A0A1G5S136_9FIRM|nr:ABC transporter ATP-binding protein [Acidaminobacter hydrogenoformans]SCZ80092.1 ABC-type nitrate/sulfonate/bicarbonate transport system, ATPase component [Acidaminobacter hydrogenoformans DSM 2784]